MEEIADQHTVTVQDMAMKLFLEDGEEGENAQPKTSQGVSYSAAGCCNTNTENTNINEKFPLVKWWSTLVAGCRNPLPATFRIRDGGQYSVGEEPDFHDVLLFVIRSAERTPTLKVSDKQLEAFNAQRSDVRDVHTILCFVVDTLDFHQLDGQEGSNYCVDGKKGEFSANLDAPSSALQDENFKTLVDESDCPNLKILLEAVDSHYTYITIPTRKNVADSRDRVFRKALAHRFFMADLYSDHYRSQELTILGADNFLAKRCGQCLLWCQVLFLKIVFKLQVVLCDVEFSMLAPENADGEGNGFCLPIHAKFLSWGFSSRDGVQRISLLRLGHPRAGPSPPGNTVRGGENARRTQQQTSRVEDLPIKKSPRLCLMGGSGGR